MDKLTKASVNYIEIIEQRLKISDDDGEPVFIPGQITKKDLKLLKDEISDVYSEDFDGLKHEAFENGRKQIQGIGYGLVNDFERFIKVGLLYSNRVYLWDYLWGRILNDIDDYKGKLTMIGNVSNSLVKIKKSVQQGGIVMLPHPYFWNKLAQIAVRELHEKPQLYTTTNYGFVNTMSVATELNLNPYTLFDPATPALDITIEESRAFNSSRHDFNLNITKFLNDEHFEIINEISANDFYSFMMKTPEFFENFRDTFLMTSDLVTEAERYQHFESKKKELIKLLENRNKSKAQEMLGHSLYGVISLAALAGIIFSASKPQVEVPALIASIAGLSTTLSKYLVDNIKKKETNTMILGFEEMRKIKESNSNF